MSTRSSSHNSLLLLTSSCNSHFTQERHYCIHGYHYSIRSSADINSHDADILPIRLTLCVDSLFVGEIEIIWRGAVRIPRDGCTGQRKNIDLPVAHNAGLGDHPDEKLSLPVRDPDPRHVCTGLRLGGDIYQLDLPQEAGARKGRGRDDRLLASMNQADIGLRNADLALQPIQFDKRDDGSARIRHRPLLDVSLRHKAANGSDQSGIAQSLSRHALGSLSLIKLALTGSLAPLMPSLLRLPILLLS